MSVIRIADAIAAARAWGVDRLDAQLLLAGLLKRSRTWVIAHDDEEFDDAVQRRFEDACRLRCDDVPLAYLLGRKEFRGLDLEVGPGVLVPRPETELLVDWAIDCLDRPLRGVSQPRVLDLGTGSGAIALALAAARPRGTVWASDASAEALAIARRNAHRLRLQVQFAQGSWWEPHAGQRFHLIVSNPPYVAAGDPHLHALRHEPATALSPGGDGLGALEAIVLGASSHLLPNGWLLVEHGADQGAAVAAMMSGAGMENVRTRQDLAGLDRCTGASKSAPPETAAQE